MNEVTQRVSRIRDRIQGAQTRCNRENRPVTLIAVTKYHPAAMVEAVVGAGLLDVGESRVQEAVAKAAAVRARARWHLIGHLQRNKAARAAQLFDVIHSVDSPRLIAALAQTGEPIQLFLQVNVSGEATKSGADPQDVQELLRACHAAPTLEPLGLMTMAPYDEDPERARPHFRTLYELQAELNRAGDGPPLECLSMGMSGDFEVAIEEGSTHIRIGTAITGERSPTGG